MNKRSQPYPPSSPSVAMPAAAAAAGVETINHAASYGARVVPAEVPAGATYWKLVEVRHLTPDENRGKHNVYVDVRNTDGKRLRDPALRIGWAWEGQRPDEAAPPAPLDKPEGEPAGNVELNRGQRLQVWIQGDGLPSDRAENLHSEHEAEIAADGAEGNYRYHHSYQVIFQRSQKEAAGDVGVTRDALNLRTGPDTAYAVIRTLPAGTTLKILEAVGAWLRIDAGGSQGFVFGEWVQRTGTAQPVDPAPSPEPLPPIGAILPPPGASAVDHQVAKTWNRFGGLLLEHAQALGIDPAVAVAVFAAEAAGEPFGPDGRLLIRFENHIFYRYWGSDHPDQFAQFFTFDGGESWRGHQWRPSPSAPWQSFHGNQNAEWQVLTFARSLDDTAALLSISMGAPQIMGFNHASIGYATVQELFAAFQADIRAQVASLFRFIQVNNLVDAVRHGDFLTVARTYNGPGAAGEYQHRIQERLDAFNRLRQAAAQAQAIAAAAPMTAPPMALPQPRAGVPGISLREVDPELYTAWSKHIQQGFANNQTMFSRVLEAFLNPYWTTVWMYRILFGVGVAAFVVAAVLAVFNANLPATALFGGLSVVAFLTYFLSRPLQALEENLQFITWLGIVYNTYWTRLVFAQNPETFQRECEQATVDAVAKIKELLDKHMERSSGRPGLR